MNYSITREQCEKLKSFDCKRLSSDERFLRDIESFSCARSEELERIIKNEAFEEDESLKKAYYLVLNKERDILGYFSLQASLLHRRFEEMEQRQQDRILKERIQEFKSKHKITEDIDLLMQELQEKEKENSLNNRFSYINPDDRKSVSDVFPAIEIGHFCINDMTNDYWASLQLPEKIRPGVLFFWRFIVPKVLNISKYIGLEYLILKAADNSDDLTLVNHYKNFMDFDEPEELKAVWPIPEFGCNLLCQDIAGLKKRMLSFWENFNAIE